MKVKDTRTQNDNTMAFANLPIGQAYEDFDGYLCIKVNDEHDKSNCLIYNHDVERWEACFEDTSTKVFPLTTTLLIER